MALCDDLKMVEQGIGRTVARAADVETLTRLNAHLLKAVNTRAARNQQMLERICLKLDIDVSDLGSRLLPS
jgi:DNA-binding Xre family transcriptional regulator